MYLRPPAITLPFPLHDGMPYSRGRHALWHGLHLLGLESGDEVLMPAYNSGAEVEAVNRSQLSCRFYDAGRDLAPDEAELCQLLSSRTRALLIIHYLGFPQDAGRWREWCDRHGLFLIEDCAPAWLAEVGDRPVGSFGDIAVFTPYKTLGLSDGSVLAAGRTSVLGKERSSALGLVPVLKRHAVWAVFRSRIIDAASARFETDAERADFDLGDVDVPVSLEARWLLRRFSALDVAERRRTNYRLLLEHLADRVPRPFDVLPDGAVPLAFPVTLGSEESDLRQRLAAAGIEARPLWPRVHPAVPPRPGADAWRARLHMLPVHQGLTDAHLERIVATVGPRPTRPRPRPGGDLHDLALVDLHEFREQWRPLAEGVGNLFATWEWNAIWWQHFGRGKRPFIWALRESSGRLVAILPFYVAARGPVPFIRMLGHGQGDRLGPICRPADAPRVARAVHRLLRAEARHGMVLGEQLPADEHWSQLLRGQILHREPSPVLHLDGCTWEGFLGGLTRNSRGQIRNKERRLRREYDVRFRLVETGEELPRALDVQFSLHESRWRAEATDDYTGAQEFHREFAAVALARGWLRLWLLEVDGYPVASWHGFRYGRADWYYQAGRDPAWDHYSVGSVLLLHTIRDAIEAGAQEYKFLRGGEAYKFRFADSDPGLETVCFGWGAGGRALSLAALAATRLPASPRRRIAHLLDRRPQRAAPVRMP